MSARLVALAALALSTTAHAADRPPLPPASRWVINYADQKCSAARAFGDAEKPVTVLIEQFGPGDAFRLSLSGTRFGTWAEQQVQLRFGPQYDWQDYNYFVGNFGKTSALVGRGSLYVIPLPADRPGAEPAATPVTPERLAGVTTLEVRKRGGLALAIGRLDRVFGELRKCTDNLVRSWGFDPAAMAQLQRGPVPVKASSPWLRDSDYPMGAVMRGQRATVDVRLNVDATGAVTACDVLQGIGGDDFKRAVCQGLMKRARFEPALDSAGKPVAAFWSQAVIFSTGQ